MGVVVAGCATELCCHAALLELAQLFGEAVYIHHNLLAEACRRCRLTVSLGEHGHVFPLVGILLQLCYQLLDERIICLLESLLD